MLAALASRQREVLMVSMVESLVQAPAASPQQWSFNSWPVLTLGTDNLQSNSESVHQLPLHPREKAILSSVIQLQTSPVSVHGQWVSTKLRGQ